MQYDYAELKIKGEDNLRKVEILVRGSSQVSFCNNKKAFSSHMPQTPESKKYRREKKIILR